MRPAARRRTPVLLSLLATLLALLLVAAACSSSGGGDNGSDSDDVAEGGAAEEVAAEGRNGADDKDLGRELSDEFDGARYGLDNALDENAPARPTNDLDGRKIIAKGNVSLESDDVATTAFHVQRLADEHGGEITERATTTNKDGDISTARLLLRIPVEDFDRAFHGLEGIGDLLSSDSGEEDVTTKVIDTQVRIRAQRRSLQRVEELLDRAQSISDIIRIEGQLTRRQADLESLERRLAYLNDQTSMSTISVNISLTPPEKEKKEQKKEEPEEAGFLAGLEDGWKALKSFGTDLATLTGQVLPFGVVLLLVGVPVLLLVRRVRRTGTDAPADVTP